MRSTPIKCANWQSKCATTHICSILQWANFSLLPRLVHLGRFWFTWHMTMAMIMAYQSTKQKNTQFKGKVQSLLESKSTTSPQWIFNAIGRLIEISDEISCNYNWNILLFGLCVCLSPLEDSFNILLEYSLRRLKTIGPNVLNFCQSVLRSLSPLSLPSRTPLVLGTDF